MDEIEKIKESIRDIAGRVNNVLESDIVQIMSRLGKNGYSVKSRPAGDHAVLFTINSLSLSICTHRRGSKQLKAPYVRRFLRVMSELELYE
jgi:hypothetical protein